MTNQYRRQKKSSKKSKTAIEAKFEAQKIAFAPLSFHATKTLRDLNILKIIHDAKKGISAKDIAKQLKISVYGIETLLEVGLNLDLVAKDDNLFFLTKTGFFILFDKMTRVNMDFVADICYKGAEHLSESILNSKPEGLKVFGNWPTVYQGLSQLPKTAQDSWFAFDHYYSDNAFDDALPIIFKNHPKKIFDIGGNTGKWATSCLNYDKEVEVTILDLAGQLNIAKKNLESLNLQERTTFNSINLLDPQSKIPQGANVIWMSQFLDCFSKEEIINILKKVNLAADKDCKIYILEPFWDLQKYEAATFSLNHTSLYFTAIANGNSKMYSFSEMIDCIKSSELKVEEVFNNVGNNDYTLIQCSKK